MIFVMTAITASTAANSIMLVFMPVRSVLSPILAKNTGEKSRYEAAVTFLATYWREFVTLQRITPAKYAPVISATPKKRSAQ